MAIASVDHLTPRQKSLAFATLIVALVLEIVDMTIVNTALPSIQADFGANATTTQWVIAGYSLSFAVLLILGGRLGDLLGYRTMFLAGVAGFTLASFLCGLAQSSEQLVIARFVQGASGAIMGPQVMGLTQILFQPLERVARLSWFGVIGGLSAILGPIIGGMLISANLFGSGWRAIFLINLPIGIIALIAGTYLLPKTRAAGTNGIDMRGTLLMGLGLTALLFPVIRDHGSQLIWWHWLMIVSAPIMLFAGWMHVRRQVAAGEPAVFDPTLFAIPTFRQGQLISISFAAANTGFLFIFAYALQTRLHYSALQTGIAHIPFSVGVMAGIGLIGRKYLPRFGRWILVGGSALMGLFAGLSLLWIYGGGTTPSLLIPVLLAAGLGMGMLSGPIPPVTVSYVDKRKAGSAGGLLKTSQQLGSAFGVAMIGGAYFQLPALVGLGAIPAALIVIETLFLICLLASLALPKVLFPAHVPDGI